MHIAFEGVLNSGTALLLKNLILDPKIALNLDDVNYSISLLKSNRESTTPPILRKDEILLSTKLSFSSSEMAAVSMCLPMVLSEYVSGENNYYYANFLLLLEIISCLQCYSFSESLLTTLEKNIEIHNKNFVLLYPKENGSSISPKLHMLTHFPNQIRRFGAPRYSWCFRYESKNAPFKKIMRRNCNFHNVPWSLSTHHQKLVGLDIRLDGEGDFFGIDNDESVLSQSNIGTVDIQFSCWSELLCEKTKLTMDSKIKFLKTVKIAGRICSKGTVFLSKLPTLDEQPSFFRIADVILSVNGLYVIMENLKTLFFCEDRFSFIVTPKRNFGVVKIIELNFSAPLHSFQYDNELHVIPNYYNLFV